MIQASLIKILLLSALLMPFLSGPEMAPRSDVSIVCSSPATEDVIRLDYSDITVAALERLAGRQHPDALYWQAMRASRQGELKQAQHLLMQAGKAGSADAWRRLSDMARRNGDIGQSEAYAACAKITPTADIITAIKMNRIGSFI